jgi:hypothetical protein
MPSRVSGHRNRGLLFKAPWDAGQAWGGSSPTNPALGRSWPC